MSDEKQIKQAVDRLRVAANNDRYLENRRLRGEGDCDKAEVVRATDTVLTALDSATARAEAAEKDVVTLTLCEVPYLFLKTDVTYRFIAMDGCEQCKFLATGGKA